MPGPGLSAGSAYVTVKPLFNRSNWSSAGKIAATGLVTITTAAAGFVKVGGEYVDSLNKIQALTDASDARMKKAAETLESQSSLYAKMGMTVGDAASGVVELTKAGLSLDDALKAVNDTMVLAKAGEMSVADASSLVANTLNTFGLKASQAGDIANYLANAANISSADVSDLAESLKYVAPVAAATGVDLKQTNAILAELSNSGISASNAGTGFRKFLLSLQAPSGRAREDLKGLGVEIFDASGKMKPLGTVIDLLNGKLSKLTDEKRQKVLKDVFGLTGVSAAQVILKNGSKGLDTYTKGVTRAGAAQKLAQSASRGFTGTLKALRAEVISDAQAAYRKLSPSLDDAAKKVLKFVQQMKSGKGAGGDFVDILEDLAAVTKQVLGFLNGLPGPVKKFAVQGLIAYAVIRKMTAVTGGWGTSMTTSVAKMKQFRAEMTYSTTRTQALKGALASVSPVLRNLAGAGGMLLLADATHRTAGDMSTLEMAAGGALSGAALGAFAGPTGAAIGGAIGGIAGAAGGLARQLKAGGDSAVDSGPKIKGYIDTLNDLTGALTGATKAQALKTLQDNHAIEQGRQLGLSSTTLVNASLGIPSAMKKVSAAVNDVNKAYDENGEIVADANGHFTKAQERALTLGPAISELTRTLGLNRKGLKADQQAWTDNQIALGKYKKALPGIPKELVTKIGTIGIKDAEEKITRLTAKYHLTPEQVKTVLQAAGERPTAAAIQRIIDKAAAYAKMHPKPRFDADTSPATGKLNALQTLINRTLQDKRLRIAADIPPGRASGGPVAQNRLYLVGEHGPELFVPSEAGRIMPHQQTMSAIARPVYRDPAPGELVRRAADASSLAPVSLSGQRMRLVVGEREFDAYVDDRADSRVDSAAAMAGMAERAFDL